MKILIMVILLLVPIHALACGALSDDSVAIDAGTIIGDGSELSFNGLPVTGKYPGDMPDIGAWEWFPGVTCETPLGDWTGIPLDYNPRETQPPSLPPNTPINLRIN